MKYLILFACFLFSCSVSDEVAGTTVGTGNPSPEPVPVSKQTSTHLVQYSDQEPSPLHLQIFPSNQNPLEDSLPKLNLTREWKRSTDSTHWFISIDSLWRDQQALNDTLHYHYFFNLEGENKVYYDSKVSFLNKSFWKVEEGDTVKNWELNFEPLVAWKGVLEIEEWLYSKTKLIFKGSPYSSTLDSNGRFHFVGVPNNLDSLQAVQLMLSPSTQMPCYECIPDVIAGDTLPDEIGFSEVYKTSIVFEDYSIGQDTLR